MKTRISLAAWFKTRPRGRIWLCLPALFAVGACATFGLLLLCWSPLRTATRYTLIVDRALAVHDFNTARVANQRRLALGIAPRTEVLFKLAESLDGLGQHQEAFAIMTKLAPADRPGYAPAHLVLAESLLRHDRLTAPAIRAVELHLAFIAAIEPHSPAAQAMLKYLHEQFVAWQAGTSNHLSLDPAALATHEVAAWVFFQTKDWSAAKPHLLAEAPYNPSVNLMLADLAAANDDPAGVRHWNLQAEAAFRKQVTQSPKDVPGDRLNWVQAEVRLGQYDAARQILEQGGQLSGTNTYAGALAGLYALWAQQITQTQPGNLAARLQCLQAGLAWDSFNPSLIEQLSALSRLEGPAAKTAGETLDKLLADGPPAAARLSVLGMTAWRQGDQETAQTYMRRAYALDPREPDLINNMAMMLALSDQPDLDGALALIQTLLDQNPEQPHYRDTRGQIYVLMGRYEDGLRDLEYSLPRLNNPPSTEKMLARAYRQLSARNGNPKLMDIAVRFEKLAAESDPVTVSSP